MRMKMVKFMKEFIEEEEEDKDEVEEEGEGRKKLVNSFLVIQDLKGYGQIFSETADLEQADTIQTIPDGRIVFVMSTSRGLSSHPLRRRNRKQYLLMSCISYFWGK